MLAIRTSKQPWLRRPSGIVELDRAHPLAKDLVAWWPLNIGGTFYERVRGNDYTLTGTNITWVGSEFGVGPSFNGSSSYAVYGGAVLNALPLTMSCWFKTESVTTNQNLIGIYNTAANNSAWYLSASGAVANDPIDAVVYDSGGSFNTSTRSTTSFTANRWHLAIGVFAASNDRAVYLDGSGKDTDTANVSPNTAALNATTLGRNDRSTKGNYFDGILGDAMIWSHALTDAEAFYLYDPRTRWALYQPVTRQVYIDLGATGAYTLTADKGTYSLTGIATGIKADRNIVGGIGSFGLTGIDTNLRAARQLSALVGEFLLTGTTTGVKADRVLSLSVGSFTLTGIDVTLTYTPSGGSPYTMTASPGSFALTGLATILRRAAQLAVSSGDFTLTGISSNLRVGRQISTSVGTFTITGINVSLSTTGSEADTDHSEYLFGTHPDPISTLSVDLHLRDDTTGDTLSVRIGPSA